MTKRAISEGIEALLGETLPVLDKGFIRVIDYMGSDSAVVQMARVSYGEGTKSVREDAALINYLMRHQHTSPFEACEIKLHLKMPIFVARQWIRHRTASVNEYSARYSAIRDEFYVPEASEIRLQDTKNKQGSGDYVSPELALQFIENVRQISSRTYAVYEQSLDRNIARELSRVVVPTNVYTEFYWKIDLHNLLHFLKLRSDSHAQPQIRAYANKIIEIVAAWCPLVYQAALDYKFNAKTLSANAISALAHLLEDFEVDKLKNNFSAHGLSASEIRELFEILISERKSVCLTEST